MLAIGATANADEAAASLVELELMLKQWAHNGPYLFTKKEGTQALSNATASYTLSTTKPVRIIECRYRDASSPTIDLPMMPLTREEYFQLPDKTTAGIPSTFYFDPQAANPVIYVWPVKATITTEALRYTYQRRIEDIDDLSNNLDIPQEWLGVCGYALAERILDDYGVSDKVGDRIQARAREMMQFAIDFEREEFLYMKPGHYRH